MRILVIGGNSTIAKAFVKHSPKEIECTVIKRDFLMNDYFSLEEKSFEGFDALINFTAAVHNAISDPQLIRRINTDLPLFLARMSIKSGITHFVQMSTIAVYGNHKTFIDSSTVEHPDSLYASSKFEADIALQNMQSDTFNVTIIRPPIVYGYNAPGNMKQLQKLIHFLPILPLGYDNNHRSILYIDNLVSALWLVIIRQAKGVILLRDTLTPSLQEITTLIIRYSKIKRYILPIPKLMVQWLCTLERLPFYKLFGSLIIDDSYAREHLGDYSLTSIDHAFKKTLQGDVK